MDETVNAVNAAQEATVEPQGKNYASHENGAGTRQPDAMASKQAQTPEENAKFAAYRRGMEARIEREKQAAVESYIASRENRSGGGKKPSGFTSGADGARLENGRGGGKEPSGFVSGADGAKLENGGGSGVSESSAGQAGCEGADGAKAAGGKRRGYADRLDFLGYIKSEYGGQGSQAGDVAPEVFLAAHSDKVPLKYALADRLAAEYKKKLGGEERGKQAAKANMDNAMTSTGSVSGGGAADGVVTETDVEAHASDTAWMMKNYDKVLKLMAKKKG